MRRCLDLILLVFSFCCIGNTYAQLDVEHYIPPFYARENVNEHYIVLSTLSTAPVNVSVTDGNGNPILNAVVTYGSPTTRLLGVGYNAVGVLREAELNTVTNEGLIVKADAPIFCNIRHSQSIQGFSLTSKGLKTAPGTRFRSGHVINRYQQIGRKSHFMSVMATEDGTTVDFSEIKNNVIFHNTPTTNNTSDPIQVVLNKGESYVIGANLDATGANGGNINDVNGTLITSDKPIVVNSGSWLAGNDGGSRDIGADQIVPIDILGTQFIFVKGLGNANLERPLVVADTDGTDVYVNGNANPVTTLNAGEFIYLPENLYTANDNMYVETTAPVFLYQTLCGPRPQNPALNFIPPLRCSGSQEVIIPNVGLLGDAEITVVARKGAWLTVNGGQVNGGQVVTGNPYWLTYKIPATNGDYYIESDSVINVALLNNYGARGGAGYFSGFAEFVEKDRGDTVQFVVCQLETSSYATYSIEGPYNSIEASFLDSSSNSTFVIDSVREDSVFFTYERLQDFSGTDTVQLTVCKVIECGGAEGDLVCETSKFVFNNINPVNTGYGTNTSVCRDTLGLLELDSLIVGSFSLGGVWLDTDTTGALFGNQFNSNMVEPGIYNFVYEVNNGPICIDTTSVKVEVLPMSEALCCQVNPVVNITNNACYSYDEGVIQLIDQYATEFSIDGLSFQTSNIFDSLSSGNYTLYAKFGSSCADTINATITEPTRLAANFDVKKVSCNGNSDAIIIVNAAGGSGSYTYQLNGGPIQTSNEFNDLAPGNKNILIFDSSSCVLDTNILITEPDILLLQVKATKDATCSLPNGEVILETLGGNSGTLTYEMITPYTQQNTSGIFTILHAGLYSFRVSDTMGCTDDIINVQVFNQASPDLSVGTFKDVTCNAALTGEVILDVNYGTAPFSFTELNTNLTQTSNQFTGLGAGSYLFEIEDANNCKDTIDITLTEPTKLLLSATVNGAFCNGVCDAEVFVEATGGISPYTASMSGTISQNDFNQYDTLRNLCAGNNLSLVVQDSNGCLVNTLVNITEPQPLQINSSTTDETCFNSCDGSITFNPTGGTGTIEYSFDNGVSYQATNNFQNLCDINHFILYKDQNNCDGALYVKVDGPSDLQISIDDTTESSCGIGNGGAVISASGGNSSIYTFEMNGVSFSNVTTATFNSLPAGVHVVTVTDNVGCTKNRTVGISDNNLDLEINNISIENVKCFGNCDGKAVVNAMGGNPPYQYALDSSSFSGVNDFPNLCANNYITAVKDGNGCIATANFDVIEPDTLIAFLATTDLKCYEGNDGIIEVTSTTGGNTGYQYQVDGNGYQNSPVLTGVSEGLHRVDIRDDSMCVYTAYALLDQPQKITPFFTVVEPLCNGLNGFVQVSASGGDQNYQYSINNGAYQASGTFANLPANNYTISVRDGNNCVIDSVFLINQPDQIQASTISTPLNCFEINDGKINIDAQGGTQPLYFSFDNGNSFYGSDSTGGLSAGTYDLVVRDDNNCTLNLQTTVTQPQPLMIDFFSFTETTCSDVNGQIDFTVVGGNPSYFYELNNGPQLPVTNQISGLSSDYHDLKILDTKGCYYDTTFLITNESEPQISSVTVISPLCFSSADGSIQVFSQAGVSPIEYQLGQNPFQTSNTFNNLEFGSYWVKIKDDNGCLDSSLVQIDRPDSVGYSVQVTDILCYGDSIGTIQVFGYGGVPIYSYSIDGGVNQQFASQFQTLKSGSYSVRITDKNGCYHDSIVQIDEPTQLTFTDVTVSNTSCYEICDGSISVALGGGTTSSVGYNYLWSGIGNGNNNTNTINNLCPGLYSLVVTDQNSCSLDSVNIVVVEPNQVIIDSASVSAIKCYGDCNGEIEIFSSDASSFIINNTGSPITSPITNLCTGYQSITPINNNGCIGRDTLIYIPTPQTIQSFSVNFEEICPGDTIEIYTEATGGTAPFSYNWNNGLDTNRSFEVILYEDTTFYVVVTDANGCVADTVASSITISPDLFITSMNDTSICKGDEIQIWADGVGGVIDYEYNWSTGDSNYTFKKAFFEDELIDVQIVDQCNQVVDTTIEITIRIPPEPSIAVNDSTACIPFISEFYNTTYGKIGKDCFWVINNDTIAGCDTISYEFTEEGCYNAQLFITDTEGCPRDSVFENAVCVIDNPIADFYQSPNNPGISNPVVQYFNQSENEENVLWNFEYIGQTNQENPEITYPEEALTYEVCLVAFNRFGCADTLCKTTSIKEESFIFIPNVFSPDGDGDNESFKPTLFNVDESTYTFTIWDRWGTMVFETKDVNEAWSGETYKDGVYVYKVSVVLNDGNRFKEVTGHVTLLR